MTARPAQPVSVLMYHAIAARGLAAGDADPHYTVTADAFARQIGRMISSGHRPRSVADLLAAGAASTTTFGVGGVGVTFDDGHCSNEAAAERLATDGATADFFVNPSTIGTAGHLDWSALRRMAALGMSIQSHGMTHRYLDQLDPATVRAELADSRAALEDEVGRRVNLFAPAGGRMPPGLIALATSLGYDAVCSSRAGLWRAGVTHAGQPLEVPRFAVLASTGDAQLQRWVEQAPAEVLRQTARHRLLTASKRMLGNAGHERLRKLLLAVREQP